MPNNTFHERDAISTDLDVIYRVDILHTVFGDSSDKFNPLEVSNGRDSTTLHKHVAIRQ